MRRKAYIVFGLGYGDEGKGTWVDHVVRQHGVRWVVRFNGGAQAAHNVISPEGVHHCFSQFGAGSLVKGTKTLLSHFVLVDPLSFSAEAEALRQKGVNTKGMVFVDENCPVITPFNSLLNKIVESSKGKMRHGSCGRGISQTQADVETIGDKALYIRDLRNRSVCEDKLMFLWRLKLDEAESIVADHPEACGKHIDILRRVDIKKLVEIYADFCKEICILRTSEVLDIISSNDVVFEGAQGVLLDQNAGFFPHVTRSNTSPQNALYLLRQAKFRGRIIRIGLLRGYWHRHGQGPFVTEDKSLILPACHNQTNEWQGIFRLGWFDCVAARYAIDFCGGIDFLAITNLDRMCGLENVKVCYAYDLGKGKGFSRIPFVGRENPIASAARTEMMMHAKPFYKNLRGWHNTAVDVHLQRYLEEVEHGLSHGINAISVSPTHSGKSVWIRKQQEEVFV